MFNAEKKLFNPARVALTKIPRNEAKIYRNIGGFRGGAEGAMPPLFFLYFQNVLRFYLENRFIKCSLVLSFETITLLYFTSQIRPECCMLHALKSEGFIWGAGWRTRPPLSEFSGSAPGKTDFLSTEEHITSPGCCLTLSSLLDVEQVSFTSRSVYHV